MDKNLIIQQLIEELKEINKISKNEFINSLESQLDKKIKDFKKTLETDVSEAFDEEDWRDRRVYLTIMLDCYDKLLINENNKEIKELFEKYKDSLVDSSWYPKMSEYGDTTKEILELKKKIFKLKREKEIIKELDTNFQEYEQQRENERLVFEEALDTSQRWHERDLEAKVEHKLKEKQLAQVQVQPK